MPGLAGQETPMTQCAVTAIIVNYRTPLLARRCVDTLFDEPAEGFRLDAVLVDGHSDDGSCEELGRFCDQHRSRAVEFLALDRNGGFGWANNQALLRRMHGEDPPEFFYLLNPDAVAVPGALGHLLALMRSKPACAAVGSLLTDEEGRALGSGFHFPSLRSELVRGSKTARLGDWLGIGDGVVTAAGAVECDWVTGASVLLRTAALRHAGIFDDGFFLYYEDVELMRRLRHAGWTVWHEPASRVVHVGGAATGLTSLRPAMRKAPRRPAYWYRSRRRYFALVEGRAVATVATLSWLAGALVWMFRSRLRLGGDHVEVTGEVVDTLRHGLIVRSRDSAPSVPREAAQIGRPPAWQVDA